MARLCCWVLLAAAPVAWTLGKNEEVDLAEMKRPELCVTDDTQSMFDSIDPEHKMTPETLLLQSVQMDYDHRMRPYMNKETLDVDVSLWVYNIGPISETAMNFRIDFYFTQSWLEPRLNLSSRLCPGTNATFPLPTDTMIWMPDTYFPTALEASTHAVTKLNQAVWLQSDGRVTVSSRVTIVSRCPMEFQYFPLDVQTCDLRFLSYGYNLLDLKMNWHEVHPIWIESDVSIAQFTLLKYRHNQSTVTFHHGSYSCLVVTFIFQRNVGYYLIQTIIPSVLCVALSWVSFFIKRDATPARASLGITTVLAVVTLIASDSWSLPRISTIKAIEVYLFSCLLFVFGALMEFSAVCYFSKPRFDTKKENYRFVSYYRQDDDHYMETPITEKMIPLEDNNHGDAETAEGAGAAGGASAKPKLEFAGFDVGRIDVFSRVGFPLAFFLFNVIYWVSYLSITRKEADKHVAAGDQIIDAM